MDKDNRKEAFRQYIHYFRFWFILLGVLAVLVAAFFIASLIMPEAERGNAAAPSERVFDYADVLTDEEEQKLMEHIARREKEQQIDIVLVTISEDVERDGFWETQMMNIADDFYDQNDYGYDKVHGDGVLLLENWYPGQEGSWLSTCGRVYEKFSDYDIDIVLDAVYERVEESPFEAYMAYVDEVGRRMDGPGFDIPPGVILIVPLVAALIYAFVHLRQEKARDTTTATSFVQGGKPAMNDSRDEFVRKNVVSRKIQTSSSGGSGRGGGHRSSGGVRHGGGGRRR